MKQITFNSMKLSNKWGELQKQMKNYDHYIDSITVTVYAHIPEPKQKIALSGYLETISNREHPILLKNNVRYSGRLTFDKPKLDRIHKELKKILTKQNISNFSIEINKLCLLVDKKLYQFKHNPQAKGLTLIAIDKNPIQNRLSESQITKLISKHFKFCQPSVCKKVYKEKWECQ